MDSHQRLCEFEILTPSSRFASKEDQLAIAQLRLSYASS
jgi:hypothetical protein